MNNTNKRKKEDVYILAANGIIEQNIVKETLDLPNAIYMTDAYHLFSSTLPNWFGAEVYSLIEHELKKMCYLKMESVIEDSFNRAMKLLKESGRLNANLEEQLQKYYNENECYDKLILVKMKGTKGLCGSTSSEQNHSSVQLTN